MNPLRPILYLGVCITLRSSLAYLSYRYPDLAQRAALLALLPVIGWLWIHFVSGRDTGPEVFGGKIWWDHLRVPHAMLWTLFAYYAYKDKYKNMAWIPLALDVLLGLVAYINNFST